MKQSLIWFAVVGFIAALLVVPWHAPSSTVQVQFSNLEQPWHDLANFKMPVVLEAVEVGVLTVNTVVQAVQSSPLPLEVIAFIASTLAGLIAFSRWSHPPSPTRAVPRLYLT